MTRLATNTTPNLGLHAWAGNDRVLREEMNDNFAEIDTSIYSLQTDNVALSGKKIYAKNHGVKLDGVTDDTVALNAFFALFGTGAELVVENGVALVTGQLFLPGNWNTSSGEKKITFNNATINYQGTPGQACLHVYNHQSSVIDGLAIDYDSVETFVNFASVWYTEVCRFNIPKITFNKDNSDITALLKSTDSYTNIFKRGLTKLDAELYGAGTSGGGLINSLSFEDVLFGQSWGWLGDPVYNVKLYGTGFQNMLFTRCDISYATTSNLYIATNQSSTARINFISCYFDSAVPLVADYNFKGTVVGLEFCQLASNQVFFLKTKSKTAMRSNGNYSLESGNISAGGMNLVKNGDFLYTNDMSGWTFTGNSTPSGSIGNPARTFLTNANATNGNSFQVTYAQTQQYVGFNGISAPFDGQYTASARLKKTSGSGKLQINFLGVLTTFDLTSIADGEELLLSSKSGDISTTQGAALFFSIICSQLNSDITIELLEVSIVPGTNAGINVPVHPKASLVVSVGTTGQRSFYKNKGQFYFDTTLNKPIWWNGTVWIDATGATV